LNPWHHAYQFNFMHLIEDVESNLIFVERDLMIMLRAKISRVSTLLIWWLWNTDSIWIRNKMLYQYYGRGIMEINTLLTLYLYGCYIRPSHVICLWRRHIANAMLLTALLILCPCLKLSGRRRHHHKLYLISSQLGK
jgi:hypothetical protein